MRTSWYIVGLGGIGSWLSYQFQKNCCHIVKQKNPLLTYIPYQQVVQVFKPEQYFFSEIIQIHQLILPIKAYSILPTLHQLQPLLAPNAKIILSHNGLGTLEPVLQHYSAYDIYFLSTTHGITSTPGQRQHTGLGETYFGAINTRAKDNEQQTFQQLQQLLPELILHPEINTFLWKKLAVNCVINPLTTLHHCKNGFLAQSKFTEIIDMCLQEVVNIAQTKAISLSHKQLMALTQSVIQRTQKNYSSMHQDYVVKKMTEINFINGYIAQLGQQHALPTPINNALYTQVIARTTYQ